MVRDVSAAMCLILHKPMLIRESHWLIECIRYVCDQQLGSGPNTPRIIIGPLE